jgi:DNA-binding transcriptional LysR family regulator
LYKPLRNYDCFAPLINGKVGEMAAETTKLKVSSSTRDRVMNDISRLTFGTVSCVREVLIQESVTKASLRLGITQPAVSQHISRFEKLTGTQVLVSEKNGTNVNQSLKEVMFSLASAQDELSRFVGQRNSGKLRLGMCECLSTAVSVGSQLISMLTEFELYVAKPIVISELFEKKEIDLFVKPLFHTEREAELCADVCVDWVSSVDWSISAPENNPKFNVMVSTQLSPYNYYTDLQLKGIDGQFKIMARIDDPVRRMIAANTAKSVTFIPGFLGDAYKGLVKSVSIFENVEKVRYGLLYNRKRVPYKTALSLFDKIEPILGRKPLSETSYEES